MKSLLLVHALLNPYKHPQGPSLSLLHCMKYMLIAILNAPGYSHSNSASYALLMLAPAARLSSKNIGTV